MIKKYSTVFIYDRGKKYLNLSTSFGGYDLGYHHSFFTKRAKNYLNLQNPHLGVSTPQKQDCAFFYKRMPWLETYPYVYFFDDLNFFLKKQPFFFDSAQKIEHFEKFEKNADLFNLPNAQNEKSPLSFCNENFLRFNETRQNIDCLLIHSLLFMTRNDLSWIPFIFLDPALSLSYPVKKILFSKKALEIEGSERFCEISKRLYRDFFRYAANKNVREKISVATDFLKKDLELFKNKIQDVKTSENHFKVELKKSSPLQTKAVFTEGRLSFFDGFAGIFHEDALYLSGAYHKNPLIFEKKLRKLLASIL